MAERARWWSTAVACGVGAAVAAPEWLPHAWTREDGPVESATFACFLCASVLALVAAHRIRPTHRPALAAVALGAVLFVAAGEEISWGQRLFEVETPAVFVDGNQQDELNLHNLEGLQHKAVIAQLAVAGAGVLLPRFVRQPWARSGFPLFAGYLAYRGTRGVAFLVGWGPAGRGSEAAELMLALGLLALTARLVVEVRRDRGWRLRGSPTLATNAQPSGWSATSP